MRLRILVTEDGAEAMGPLMQAVMDVLWDGGPGTPQAIQRRINTGAEPDKAFTTVSTTLYRLATQGLVTRDRRRRSWAAAVTREELDAVVCERLRAALAQVEAVAV